MNLPVAASPSRPAAGFASAASAVREALMELTALPGGHHRCIRARREHGARAVEIGEPALAILLSGSKQLHNGEQRLLLQPGDALLVARRCRADVVNIPDAQTRQYLTLMLPLCSEVLDAVRSLWTRPLPAAGPDLQQLAVDTPLAQPLLRWTAAALRDDDDDARMALAELVFALCRAGHSQLLLPTRSTLAQRIRARVGEHPARDWRSADFEAELGLSAATLRRRLAAEHSGLRQLITEARLSAALNMLYTSAWPVKTVAARVGYRSSSSFAQQFAARYGIEPSQIGNGD